jgi:UDP-N-acetylglucosamine pyrophosphorylase
MRFELLNKLKFFHADSLHSMLSGLSSSQLENLEKQIDCFGPFLEEQRSALDQNQREEEEEAVSPALEGYPWEERGLLSDRGKSLIGSGKVVAICLAGGLGARLAQGVKGKIPISLTGKTLFQIFFEKVAAASRAYQRPLMVAVMISQQNYDETLTYLKQHQFFHVDPSQVFLFIQEEIPYLDEEGNWFLQEKDLLATAPCGNGDLPRALKKAGILSRWRDLKVQWITITPIDNPLANPFDPFQIGLQESLGVDVTLKAVPRLHEKEEVGILVLKEGRLQIAEYLEQKRDVLKEQVLLANTGLFSFSLDFLNRMSEVSFPWHLSLKKVVFSEKKLWKFEKFLFDGLKIANEIAIVVCSRADTFAPLKRLEGESGIEAVQTALWQKDCRTLERITGLQPPADLLEIDRAFEYPTDSLLKEYKGKKLIPIQGYVGLE